MAKRLLDHDSAPLSLLFRDQARRSEARNRHTEEAVRNREIEEAIARSSCRLVESDEMRVKPAVHFGICQVALQITHAIGQALPGVLVNMIHCELGIAVNNAPPSLGPNGPSSLCPL